MGDNLSEMNAVSEMVQVRQVTEVKPVRRRRKLVNRAGARIRRMARHTGEIGLKIVALPTFVLLDMLS